PSALAALPAPSTTLLSTLSLHDALPISLSSSASARIASRCSRTSANTSSTRCAIVGSCFSCAQWNERICSRSSPTSESPCRSTRSEEHTCELQSRENLVCRLLLEKKKQQ